jgi:FixJ family two-component response regulator
MVRRLRLIKPGVRVLYMSGYAEDIRAKRTHIDDSAQFLEKPFTSAGLLSAVQESLRLRTTPKRRSPA